MSPASCGGGFVQLVFCINADALVRGSIHETACGNARMLFGLTAIFYIYL